MRSMTGYGRANFEIAGKQFTAEITAVNQKGLALGFFVPADWNNSQAERLLAPLVKKFATRGKINVYIKSEAALDGNDFDIDDALFLKIFGKMRELGNAVGVDLQRDSVAVMHAIDICNKRSGGNFSVDDSREQILAGVMAALENFQKMRETEGENLRADLRSRVEKLEKIAEKIREVSAETVPHFREILRERLKNLGLEIDLNDERFIKEITIFADRCDISEECTRLSSHLQQFAGTMDEDDCGRKLDFICQEILRELNTMGSKANNVEITKLVVAAKNEQERLREQVQNIE